MSDFNPTMSPRWYETSRFRTIAISILAIILIGEGTVAVLQRDNDFECHRNVGVLFLAKKPYEHDSFIMYPLGRVMMDGLLALVPYRVSRAICFILALLAVYATFRIWRRLADANAPLGQSVTIAAALFTAMMTIGYLLRDFDECGLQLFLLFFLSMALADLAQGRYARTGFWLATAAVYKAVPILFLPYLIWKREWRAAGWMTVFIGVWCAAPIPYLGLEKTAEAHEKWLAHIGRVMAKRSAYPDQLVEPQRTDNLSLPALLARNLETYPPGHTLFVDHPWFWQPGTLSPEHAYIAVRLILLALGLALAWRFRTSFQGAAERVVEWSAVCLLCAILSPICWKQHLVLELPAIFLVVRATLAQAWIPRWRTGCLIGFGVLANLSSSFFLTGDLRELAHVYKLDPIAALFMLTLVLNLPNTLRTSTATQMIREYSKAA